MFSLKNIFVLDFILYFYTKYYINEFNFIQQFLVLCIYYLYLKKFANELLRSFESLLFWYTDLCDYFLLHKEGDILYNFKDSKGLYTLKCGHNFALPLTGISDSRDILCPMGCDMKITTHNDYLKCQECLKEFDYEDFHFLKHLPCLKCRSKVLKCQECLKEFDYEDFHFLKHLQCHHTFENSLKIVDV